MSALGRKGTLAFGIELKQQLAVRPNACASPAGSVTTSARSVRMLKLPS